MLKNKFAFFELTMRIKSPEWGIIYKRTKWIIIWKTNKKQSAHTILIFKQYNDSYSVSEY